MDWTYKINRARQQAYKSREKAVLDERRRVWLSASSRMRKLEEMKAEIDFRIEEVGLSLQRAEKELEEIVNGILK